MPYVLNVVSVGGAVVEPLTRGALIAEPDSPPTCTLEVGGRTFAGVRYLVVSDDGTGYRSGMPLVHVPSEAEEPSRMRVAPEVRKDLRALLAELLARSPVRQLVLYLEANRIISRPDPREEFPAQPRLHPATSLDAVLATMDQDRFAEEEVFLVEGG